MHLTLRELMSLSLNTLSWMWGANCASLRAAALYRAAHNIGKQQGSNQQHNRRGSMSKMGVCWEGE